MDKNLVFKAYAILQRIGAYLNISFEKNLSGFPTEKHVCHVEDLRRRAKRFTPTSGIF